jgi:hypothetical protein
LGVGKPIRRQEPHHAAYQYAGRLDQW